MGAGAGAGASAGAGAGASATGAGDPCGTACMQPSPKKQRHQLHRSVKNNGINSMYEKGSYCIIHDQFIDHSAGRLRPPEPLAWAWAPAQVLRPALPGSMHRKTKASYEKGS